MTLSKTKREQLLKQVCNEYDHALKYRQKRETKWSEVDDLYFGKKKKSLVSRANIHIPKLYGTIETFISKVDDPPYIYFEAMEEGDRPKAPKLNALLRYFSNKESWELKDILSKKQAALYGRTIYKKYSTSEEGFSDYLDVVDVLDFLIDPMAGGVTPIKSANYLGQDNIIRSKYQLQDDIYDSAAVKRLAKKLNSDSDADSSQSPHQQRRASLDLSEAVLTSQDSIRLTEWYTHFEGEKVYVLFSRDFMEAVRTLPLTDLIGADEFPFSAWGVFPNLSEFWTPGLGELMMETNKVQNIIVSQILDNNAYRNYGMKAVDVTKIPKKAQLTPRPGGVISVNGNPNEAIKDITFPDLSNALATYRMLDGIFDAEVGVTSQAKGTPNSKRMSATEFAGLLDQTADRLFTANKTYSNCLKRIAYLFLLGVEQNLSRNKRVRILGATGYEWKEVSAKDAKGNFDILISTGVSDEQNRNMERDRFREYLDRARQNERLNQKFLDEKEAQVAGMDQSEIQRLLNPEMEGNWEIIAEAAAENEEMLSKKVEPNRGSTSGHVQKHLDYVVNTDLPEKIRARILKHAQEEVNFVLKNADYNAKKMVTAMAAQQQPAPQVLQSQPQPQAQLSGPRPATPNFQPATSMPEQVRQSAIANAPVPPTI
jgi:hypothetical protein